MSATVPRTPSPALRVAVLGLLTAAAVALQVLESPLPRPLPWCKPGLANSATLAALVLYGLPAGLLVVLARQMASNLLLGTLLGSSFILGLSGGVAAALAMRTALGAASGRLGLVSISIVGALANNFGQLLVAQGLLGHGAVWVQLPLMMTVSLPSGALIGVLSWAMLARMRDTPSLQGSNSLPAGSSPS